MKPSEFAEVKERFEVEQLYWEALKPGQIVFEEFGRFFDMEYFKHEIISVNVNERVLKTKDYSQKGLIGDLRSFSTIPELEKRGIFLQV